MGNIEVQTERTADVIDVASQAEAVAREAARELARTRVLPEKVVNEDGTVTTQGKDSSGHWRVVTCQCGEDLPEARMALGKVRCMPCQTRREKRASGY